MSKMQKEFSVDFVIMMSYLGDADDSHVDAGRCGPIARPKHPIQNAAQTLNSNTWNRRLGRKLKNCVESIWNINSFIFPLKLPL